MLDIHAGALRNVNEGYHNFLLRYKKTDHIVYGFVEGKDDPMFYRSIIERFLPEDWGIYLIKAGGRGKVIDSYESLDWSEYDKRRICFFVDKDLTGFAPVKQINDINVYCTDSYSIENSIVTAEVFLRLLGEVFNIVDLSPQEENLVNSVFTENLKRFEEALRPIMFQIVGWRRAGGSANLDNLDLKPLIGFSTGEMFVLPQHKTNESRVAHAAKCVGAATPDQTQLEAIEREMAQQADCIPPTRGKYLLWFLVHFANHVHSEITRFSSAYEKAPKCKLTLGISNIMVVVAPRARCPTSLRRFIQDTFLSYIHSVG
jgi:hypothetical protein